MLRFDYAHDIYGVVMIECVFAYSSFYSVDGPHRAQYRSRNVSRLAYRIFCSSKCLIVFRSDIYCILETLSIHKFHSTLWSAFMEFPSF